MIAERGLSLLVICTCCHILLSVSPKIIPKKCVPTKDTLSHNIVAKKFVFKMLKRIHTVRIDPFYVDTLITPDSFHVVLRSVAL